MSRKRAKSARRAAPPSARKRRRAPSALISTIGVVAIALLGWWLLSKRAAPTRHVATTTEDPVAIIERALTLSHQGLHLQALQALSGIAATYDLTPMGRHDYATVLLNAVHQQRQHLGRQEFAVRSSVERVELVKTALFELGEAERSAQEPRDRAWAMRTGAQAFGVWGFPWEAVVGYRQAEHADTTWGEMTARAERVLMEMQHPERLKP